jgi:succinate dehydrogenase hydrophobic anchor subunit
MKIVLNAIILMFSVICIIGFLLFVENITPETHFLSREMINAVVYGWLGLYLLRLYWSYSQKESGGTKDE